MKGYLSRHADVEGVRSRGCVKDVVSIFQMQHQESRSLCRGEVTGGREQHKEEDPWQWLGTRPVKRVGVLAPLK